MATRTKLLLFTYIFLLCGSEFAVGMSQCPTGQTRRSTLAFCEDGKCEIFDEEGIFLEMGEVLFGDCTFRHEDDSFIVTWKETSGKFCIVDLIFCVDDKYDRDRSKGGRSSRGGFSSSSGSGSRCEDKSSDD